jgi:hypothetical protein
MRYLALLVLSSFSNLPKLSKNTKASLARSLSEQDLPALFRPPVNNQAEENLVEMTGIEPVTSALQRRRSPN